MIRGRKPFVRADIFFPPKDLFSSSPFPLYTNITVPPLLRNDSIRQEISETLTVLKSYFRHVHLFVVSSRSAKYGAFLRMGGRGISGPRSSHSGCSIESFRFPSIAMTQRSHWSYTKGCWSWIASTASFAWPKLISSSDAWISISSGTLWRTATLWREKKEPTCEAAKNSDAWKRRLPSGPQALHISRATISAPSFRPVVWPMRNFAWSYDFCLSLNRKAFLVTLRAHPSSTSLFTKLWGDLETEETKQDAFPKSPRNADELILTARTMLITRVACAAGFLSQ